MVVLRPIEHGMGARRLQGLAPLYHVRLKQHGQTLAVLSGGSVEEAWQRAQRLAEALLPNGGASIEQA